MGYTRAIAWLIGGIGSAMSLWHMWVIAAAPPEALFFRGGHLMFAMVLVFLIYPFRGETKGAPGALDWACLFGSSI
jgi:TRAP-type uncharacterized transport system fused permease subunit